ncbi:hypothetical protein CDAR_77881 [Caerostris darwini]|uniref:Uncharacterized protein n=1 Tax=Caerostris darwini TaxID=1538125 RepID=A0AAV4NF73_9ARAC|nr:hypothetical protein CDAR_77881 [Caerostris darwini]
MCLSERGIVVNTSIFAIIPYSLRLHKCLSHTKDLTRGQSDRYELTFNSTRHILCEALKLHILIPEQIFSCKCSSYAVIPVWECQNTQKQVVVLQKWEGEKDHIRIPFSPPLKQRDPHPPILTARAERGRQTVSDSLGPDHRSLSGHFSRTKTSPLPSSFITLGEDLIGWFGQNALPSHEERGMNKDGGEVTFAQNGRRWGRA